MPIDINYGIISSKTLFSNLIKKVMLSSILQNWMSNVLESLVKKTCYKFLLHYKPFCLGLTEGLLIMVKLLKTLLKTYFIHILHISLQYFNTSNIS